MSSIAPLVSRELSVKLAKKGVEMLDADHGSLVRYYEKMAKVEVKR